MLAYRPATATRDLEGLVIEAEAEILHLREPAHLAAIATVVVTVRAKMT